MSVTEKLRQVLAFLRRDVWRIRSGELPRAKSLLLTQLRVLLLAVRGFASNRCSLRASALTFYTVLSIVPAVAIAFGVAKGFGLESMLEERLAGALKGQEEVASRVVQFSRSLLEDAKGGVIAGLGVALLFATVIKVLTHVEKSFNDIWGVKQHRTLGRRFADYLAIMLVCPVLLIVSASVTVAVTGKAQAVVQSVALLGFLAPLVSLLIRLAPYCIGWAMFAFVCIFIPNTKVKLASGVVGGIVAGTLYQIVQWIYIAFQIGVARYNAVYGSFAALPLFLIWLQLSWLVVLFGAELSFAYQNVETYEFEPDCLGASQSFKRLLALRLAQMVVRNFAEGRQAPMAASLSHELGVPIRLVNELLYELVEAKVLSEAPGEAPPDVAYQPARTIDGLTIASVLEALDGRAASVIPVIESPQLARLSGCLREFGEAVRASSSNIALKDI